MFISQKCPISSPFDPSHYCKYASSPPSYIYSSNTYDEYRFPDPKMKQFSFIPALEINNKEIIFTFNRQHALYCGGNFIFSLKSLIEKISLPKQLSQDLLDKVATIANYLAQGDQYKYLKGSAIQKESSMTFLVKRGIELFKVTVSSLTEDGNIYYSKAESS